MYPLFGAAASVTHVGGAAIAEYENVLSGCRHTDPTGYVGTKQSAALTQAERPKIQGVVGSVTPLLRCYAEAECGVLAERRGRAEGGSSTFNPRDMLPRRTRRMSRQPRRGDEQAEQT